MRNLRNAITVVAISLLPPVAVCHQGKLKGKRGRRIARGLGVVESPHVGDFLDQGNEDSGVAVFYEETETLEMWHTREQTWRTEPRTNRNGGIDGKAPEWSWKDTPCIPKASKKGGTASPNTFPTQVPSQQPSRKPSAFPTGLTPPPPKDSKKGGPKISECPEEPGTPGGKGGNGGDQNIGGGDVPGANPDYPGVIPDNPGVIPDNPGDIPDNPGGNPNNPDVVLPIDTPAPAFPGDTSPSPSASPSAIPSGAPNGGDFEINQETCSLIEAQDGYTVNSDASLSEFVANLSITFQTAPSLGMLTVLNGSYRSVIALWVAGCEARALEMADSLAGGRRRLQSETSIDYVGLLFSAVTETCNAVTPPPDCTDEFKGAFSIYHFAADGADEMLKNRIEEAFARFSGLLPKLASEAGNGDIAVTVGVVQTEDDSNKAVTPPVSADSVNVATLIGATAGGLAVILLLVLLVRRNQGEEEISHLKLEEDQGDDTFIREFASTASSPSRDEDYEARNVHVVGEADSIFSGWTGYTAKDRNEAGRLDRGDVHKCSSATCEVCEQRRQQGIQFIPTGKPMRPQLPSDSSRDYTAEDTVEL